MLSNARDVAGADPTKLIEDLAKRNKVRTLGVSMGQGQEVIARKLLAQATVEGQWVLLQNTHLGLGFLSEVCVGLASMPFILNKCACLHDMTAAASCTAAGNAPLSPLNGEEAPSVALLVRCCMQ